MDKKYIDISTLNNYLKHKFETDPNIQKVYLKGEISNFKAHTRGHYYFTLKDETSRINAVMFGFNTNKILFTPADGVKVLVEGKVSIYPATGSYQIYVEDMQEDGLGNLYLKYEALKKELESKGLFDQTHKKELPKYPTKIGIVTASTGAAVKDILSTIKRRYPICETILFPCLVQGELAANDIAKQIKKAQNYDLDLLIVGRGGGSIEDMWAFNETVVAYAIYESIIPIISAVGHEIDFTISDYVADKRAPTPTGAAEMAVPNIKDLLFLIKQYQLRITKIIQKDLNSDSKRLYTLKNSYVLLNPLAAYEIKEQKLSNFITNLNNIILHKLKIMQNRFIVIKDNYVLNNPDTLFKNKKYNYTLLLNKLEILNPLHILSKGYSVVTKDNQVISDIKNIKIGENINIRMYKGLINAKVEGKEKNGKEEI